ncbi:phosphatidylglycerol phospholipase C [Colletotrichum spaethianum]|uniref:Phosphatidylglycerol phospholipase C n=1 Tax=Colletotrichum spaethianum TaxID=700344 RepID=A0AA37PB40_9PEZI|nr:phosphatidylglycerol phospholipase C [Colletotrichum spaethianum]GKT49011.1 phosphatidylglycerol phospholipase C [Colletotrichum spaethianum]
MSSETKPLLGKKSSIPSASFTSSLPARRLPQAIAHRGFKSLYPENTLLAFRGALDAGAHALETDLHLSRDGVVVLSHDGNLKRCFGVDKKINECDWAYLETLQTVMEPGEKMPRLEDLLVFLAEEGAGRDEVWVLLDIKVETGLLLRDASADTLGEQTDDPPAELLGHVAEVLTSTPGPVPWEKRIVFGCWNQPYITHVRTILPTYPLALISWSPLYARKFLSPSQPNLSFNMFQKALVGPVGKLFIRKVRKADRKLFVWTVNDEEWMEWSIAAGADGVITDDPEMFLEVCRRWEGGDGSDSAARPKGTGEEPAAKAARRAGRVRDGTWGRTLRLYFQIVSVQVLVLLFTPLLMIFARFGFVAPGPKAAKALRL